MKAQAQLGAFPQSANQRARQTTYIKAVVSLRLSGSVIGKLDAIVAKHNEGKNYWERITRTRLIEQGINELIARATKKAKKGKKR